VKCGFICEVAPDFPSAALKTDHHSYDTIVIFLRNRVREGMELVERIRRDDNETGLFTVCEANPFDQQVLFLENGADDCVHRDIDPHAFWARIKVVQRRRYQLPPIRIDFGCLQLCVQEHRAMVDGKPLDLTRKEFSLLLFFIRNRNRVLSKGKIAEQLWGDHMEESTNFDFVYAHLKNLRRKLSPFGCAGYIRTIYGIGYRCQM